VAVRPVPLSKAKGGAIPSVSAGAANTVYFGYVNSDGHPNVAVSRNHGATWSKPFDAGQPFGIQNAEFSEVIAGDDDRAAFAFLGTPRPATTSRGDFRGVWHLYLATSYDGGNTWTTVTRRRPIPCSAAASGTAAARTSAATCLDSTTFTVDKIGRGWWGSPTDAPAPA